MRYIFTGLLLLTCSINANVQDYGAGGTYKVDRYGDKKTFTRPEVGLHMPPEVGFHISQ